jgi:hypothetical protein
MKDENGNLLADSHNILNRWKYYFSQILRYIGSVILGRYKYIERSHLDLTLVPLRLKLLLQI